MALEPQAETPPTPPHPQREPQAPDATQTCHPSGAHKRAYPSLRNTHEGRASGLVAAATAAEEEGGVTLGRGQPLCFRQALHLSGLGEVRVRWGEGRQSRDFSAKSHGNGCHTGLRFVRKNIQIKIDLT